MPLIQARASPLKRLPHGDGSHTGPATERLYVGADSSAMLEKSLLHLLGDVLIADVVFVSGLEHELNPRKLFANKISD